MSEANLGNYSYLHKDKNYEKNLQPSVVNAVQYCEILYKYLQELGQNIYQMLDPQKHPMQVMRCLMWIFVREMTAS